MMNVATRSNTTVRCELIESIEPLGDHYASIRAPAIINHELRIGGVFAEYKDKLVIIDGEDKIEHEYLIPRSKVDRYASTPSVEM
jgi:hypothetical protein